MELPHPVVFLPVIVDHQHAGGKAVGQDIVGIFADAVLTLIVDQLDPGVVLRLDEEQFVGDFARCSGSRCG